MISVIVPCYGPVYAKFLGECVASVEAQTFKDWEVVIATGCAGDESARVARSLDSRVRCETDYRVRVLEDVADSVRGKPYARNKGIRAARGEWILPLDADDKLDPTCLEKMWERLPRSPVGMVTSDLREFGLRSNTWTLPIGTPRKSRIGFVTEPVNDHVRRVLPNENVLSHSTLFSKYAWELCGGYDEADFNIEDWDLWLRMWRYCNPVLEVIHKPLLLHRVHGQNDYAMHLNEDFPWNKINLALLKFRHRHLYSKEEVLYFTQTILTEMTPEFEEKIRLRAQHLPDCASLKDILALLDSRKAPVS